MKGPVFLKPNSVQQVCVQSDRGKSVKRRVVHHLNGLSAKSNWQSSHDVSKLRMLHIFIAE